MYRVLAALGALLVPVSATANTDTILCAPHGELLAYLQSAYDEQPAASGKAGDGSTFEILASEKGSWTLVVTSPDGRACAEASGNNWRQGPLHAVFGAPRT